MTSRLLHLSRMMKSERLVIALLRGKPSTRLRQDTVELFVALHRTMIASGCSIAPATSPFLRQDEAILLAQLAAMQRQGVDQTETVRGPLEDMLKTCATRLKDEGILLDFRSVARSFAASSGVRQVKPQASSADNLPHRRTMEARAMDFLSERGQAKTSDLVNVGISRQMLSLMVKRGTLLRVRHGIYSTPKQCEVRS